MVHRSYQGFSLEIGDPTLVWQGAAGDNKWGHYQFPALHPAENGAIVAAWGYHDDSVTRSGYSDAVVTDAASDDLGRTWRRVTPEDRKASGVPMPNGRLFVGINGKAGYQAAFLKNHTPVSTNRTGGVFFAEDLPEMGPPELTGTEYDPKTGTLHTFPVTVNWRHMPVSTWMQDTVIPVAYYLNIHCHYGVIALDDGLYYCTYARGFDSDAPTKADAVHKYCAYFQVYVFRSTDCGRTWNYLSERLVTDDEFIPSTVFEGFCEPSMAQMADGSVVMLMRTGGGWVQDHGSPCYLTRSTDRCRTWSKPVRFDSVGVLPLIRRLGCGITLATYGRPGLYLRATADPSGLTWEEPVAVPLTDGPEWRSCYYTDLLPLDANSVLMIHTDFHRPLPDGSGEGKSVVVRKITVKREV